MKTNRTFNEIAKSYYEERTSKNFDTIYLELRRIGNIARRGLTVDDDDFESITTDLAMRLMNDFDKLYSEQKSLFSYCLKAFKSKYFSLLKKYNKFVRESSMIRPDEDANSIFEVLVAREHDFYDSSEEDPCDVLHNSPKLQAEKFYELVEDMYEDEIELMKDIFTFRRDDEVGNASIWVSPEELAKKYGMNNRTTISAKRTRAIQKIAPLLAEQIELSKALDGGHANGKAKIGDTTIKFEGKIVTEVVKTDKNGLITKKTKIDGGWKIETTNKKGVLLVEGVKDDDDKRIGVWTEYHENGKVSARVNYDHDMRFMTFDTFGNGIQMGKLR